MNPTLDRVRLKALVTQAMISLLEDDVFGAPAGSPATERGGAERHPARDEAGEDSILYIPASKLRQERAHPGLPG